MTECNKKVRAAIFRERESDRLCKGHRALLSEYLDSTTFGYRRKEAIKICSVLKVVSDKIFMEIFIDSTCSDRLKEENRRKSWGTTVEDHPWYF